MTDTIGLGLREEPPPQQPLERKRPGIAWLLGSLYPGLGAAYLRKWPRAAWTAVGFTAAVGYMVYSIAAERPEESAIDVAFRAAIFLYAFSFLDAFYTAREINSGADAVAGDLNPRVAAILNFLSNGLGYFYVGDRRLGIGVIFLCYFGYRLLGRAVESATAVVLVAVFLAELGFRSFLALDAYGRSHKQRRARLEGTPLRPVSDQPAVHLEVPATGPIVIAGLLAGAYVLFMAYAILAPTPE